MWEKEKKSILTGLPDYPKRYYGLGKVERDEYRLKIDAAFERACRESDKYWNEYNKVWHWSDAGIYKFLKGSSVDRKRRVAKEWLRDYIVPISGKNLVYILWKKQKCLWVGQTKSGGKRFRTVHRAEPWQKANRIEIRVPNGKTKLSMVECMSIHLLQPTYNKILSPNRKYQAFCPICKALRDFKAGIYVSL